MRLRKHLRDKLPSYEAIARDMGVVLCADPCPAVQYQHHWDGYVRAESPPTVHWTTTSRWSERPRKVTRKGVQKFTKLAYRAQNGATRPSWQLLFEEDMAAIGVARRFGFRYDRKVFEDDRARLRFLLRDPADREGALAQRAWRWAEKRYD